MRCGSLGGIEVAKRWSSNGALSDAGICLADSLAVVIDIFNNFLQTPHHATTMSGNDSRSQPTPVLLLKTKSTPNDGYQEQFSPHKNESSFQPIFVPVLEHQFLEDGLMVVRNLLRNKEISKSARSKYGGMIFTSQRAVEAFAKLVEEGKGAYSLSPLQAL